MTKKADHLARGKYRVPQKKRSRATAFDAERKAVFLGALIETCNVTEAARQAGIWPQTAYKHRDRYASFHDRWMAALSQGYDRLELAMLKRALHGRDEDVWHAGKKVGTCKRFDDRVGLMLLEQHRKAVRGGQTGATVKAEATAAREEIEATFKVIWKRLGCGDTDAGTA